MADGIENKGVQIYDKAVEEYLSEHYGYIKRDDGKFYDMNAGMYGSDPQSQEFYENQMRERISEAEGKFQDVPTMFNEFTVLPEPGDYDEPIAGVETAMGMLSSGQDGVSDPLSGHLFPFNTELVDMTNAAGYIDDWDGLTMQNFVENFTSKFPARCLNQFAAAVVLVNALRAEQAIWVEVPKNINQIADDTLKALDHMHDCGKNEWEMAFSVVGAVATVAALTVASGGTAAIALGAVGAASLVGKTAAAQVEDPPKPKYSGESAEAVVNSCRQAVKDLKKYIVEAEDKIANACSNANGTLGAQGEDYVAPKPQILDQDHPDIGQPTNA